MPEKEISERLAYGVRHAAQLLDMSEYVLRSLIRSGKMPAAKVKGRILIPRTTLVSFLEERTTTSGERIREIPAHIRVKMGGANV